MELHARSNRVGGQERLHRPGWNHTQGRWLMGRKKGWSVGKTRSLLYRSAALLGDFQAIRKGRVLKRVARRAAGRATGRGLGRLFR